MSVTRLNKTLVGIICSVIASYLVFIHGSHTVAGLVWIVGIGMFWLYFSNGSLHIPSKSRADMLRMIFLCILHVMLLGLFSSFNTHYHQDEFITAYTSYSLKFPAIQWFGTFPDVWISRFPVVFHILQLPFFLLLGPTVQAIRISILPYVFIIVLALDTIAVQTLGKKSAYIVGIIYATLAPHLYLSSIGLHFISATAFYMVAIVYLLRLIENHAGTNIFWFGFWTSFCFLTYTSGYAILPVTIIILAVIFIKKNYEGVQKITISLGIAIAILAPFIAYARISDNFFMTRVAQVNALFGTQVDMLPHSFGQRIQIIQSHIIDSTKAIALPGIGGTGGYSFGNLALLDPLTCTFFVIGIILGIVMWVKKKNLVFLFLLLCISIPWVIGYIGSIHPPPFHRLSIVYPLIAYVVALPLTQISVITSKRKKIIIGLLVTVCGWNIYHAMQMIQKEKTTYPQNSRVIAEYIKKIVPLGTPIPIAAYPNFYLSQELVFRLKGHYPIRTETIEEYIQNDEVPLIILNISPDTAAYVRSKYPYSTIMDTIDDVSLKDLVLIKK